MEEHGEGVVHVIPLKLRWTSSLSGDKSEHEILAQNLLEASNLPVAVPNYRLSARDTSPGEGTFKHPLHAQDIALALRVIKESSQIMGIADSERIFLVGHSCGAHMISTLLLDPPPGEGVPLNPPVESELLVAIKGVILAEGIYDLELLLKSFPDPYYRKFIEGAFPLSAASPFTHYSVTRYRMKRGHTLPWIVVHSLQDTLVDDLQARAMHQHLQSEHRRLGLDTELVQFKIHAMGDHDEMLTSFEFARIVADVV